MSTKPGQLHTVLGTCLGQAVHLGLLATSPLARVPKPRSVRKERQYWTAEQAQQFLTVAASAEDRHAPLCVFLLGTGCRISEALGMRWSDIRPEQPTVAVRRALVHVGSEATIQPPKSKAGARTLTLPGIAVEALARLPQPHDPAAPVFVTGKGTPPRPANVYRSLMALCDKAGLPRVSPHGLRHVHAALLAAHGLDPHTLRQRLGHTRASMTLDVYAYAVRPDSAAADAFDRAIGD